MSIETKKVVWTTLSLGIVLALALGICFAVFYPKSVTPAPASFMSTIPSRTVSPDSYLKSVEPAPVPGPSADAADDGTRNFVFNYGDRPPEDSLPSGTNAVTPNINVQVTGTSPAVSPAIGPTGAAQAAAKPKSYTPAPAVPPGGTSVAAPAVPKTAKLPVAKSVDAKVANAKPAPSAEYWLQAASFSARTRADDLQRTLAVKGLSSVISVKDIDGKSYYRVRIGPYMRKGDAEGWLPKVKALPGCEEAYVAKQVVQR